ncbi:hypothetical protein EYZ11_013547 [Aspergillus tanneri]|uniref:Uncharacterized protein n=1 Tax=Aspergillus tanneri TaxID=1220188 RepID=A0A4S3IZJ8_9EURO|nr:hypothetical protein EYZ11_013547 [Aspergillus tanneri]
MRSYENENPQDLDDFDRIAEDLGKFARPASQDDLVVSSPTAKTLAEAFIYGNRYPINSSDE